MKPKYRVVGQKGLMLAALGIFLAETLGIVVVNSLMGHGVHFEWTISRYVGLETWSAVTFAVLNFVVMLMMLYYLYGVGESWQMGRGFYVLVVVIVLALVGLSACPLGYFDVAGAVSLVSRVHEFCSRSMFVMMLVLAVVVMTCRQATRATRVLVGVFVGYGLVCAYGFLVRADWFIGGGLIFEAVYLLGFMGWCLGCQTKKTLVGKSRIIKQEKGKR